MQKTRSNSFGESIIKYSKYFSLAFVLFALLFNPWILNKLFVPNIESLEKLVLFAGILTLELLCLIIAGIFYFKASFFARYYQEILLLCFSILFCVAILELGVRVSYFGPKGLVPWLGDSVFNIGDSGLITPSEDCNLIYEWKENLSTDFKLVPFQTNSYGLRDIEYSFEKGTSTYRVAVLGDSLTTPDGVGLNESYHSRLEDHYSLTGDWETYEFINFGVSGYTLKQYYYSLLLKGEEYTPDHVLVGLTVGNDIPVVGELSSYCNYVTREKKNSYLIPWSGYFIFDKVSNVLTPAEDIAPVYPPKNYDLESFTQTVKLFSEYSEKHSIPITFVALRRGTDENPYEFQLFKQVLAIHGLQLIDTAKYFEGSAFTEYGTGKKHQIYKWDTHPNGDANAVFAEAIYQEIDIH